MLDSSVTSPLNAVTVSSSRIKPGFMPFTPSMNRDIQAFSPHGTTIQLVAKFPKNDKHTDRT